MPSVIDTNVLIAANGRNTHATASCQLSCIEAIQYLLKNARTNPIAIDDQGLILNEYKAYLNFHGQPGVGDLFYKFLHDQMYTDHSVIMVAIRKSTDKSKGFEEIPENNLDTSDRKFLAVAAASSSEIFNATDSDWDENAETLNDLGIKVIQLCPNHATKTK